MLQVDSPLLRWSDQVFTHKDPDGTVRNFAVSVMERYCKAKNYPITQGFIDKDSATMILQERGIEYDRLELMLPEHRDIPVLFCDMDDGSKLLVDGHHRYIRRMMDGFDFIDCYILPEKLWEQFLIVGLPDDDATVARMMTEPSGVQMVHALMKVIKD